MYQTLFSSPLGNFLLKANENALTEIQFDGELIGHEMLNEILIQTQSELTQYFDGQLKEFTIPLAPQGTDFQKGVWKQLQKIKFGEQISYKRLSILLGNVLAIRAVANANGKNPIPIIIPCHRVVGSNGALVGFSGGLWRKQFLLALEENTLF